MSDPQRKIITVYGASSPSLDTVFHDAAYELGKLLAQNGREAVTGAGSTGLMAALENGVLDAGGKVTGIIPQFMVNAGWLHQGLSEVIITADMHERKKRMAQMSHAAIALPGGTGTFEELFEIITWKMLDLYVKPVIILNTDHYYDPMLDMLDNAIRHKFMNPMHKSLWAVADTPKQALELLDSIPDWNSPANKIESLK